MHKPPPLLELDRVSLSFEMDLFRSQSFREWVARPLRSSSAPTQIVIADQISLAIAPGERVGILGRNGTGKTSLCRMIAGIYSQESGKITVRGTVRSVLDTSVGTHADLTGRENLEVLSHFIYGERTDRREIVQEAIDWSELHEQIDMPLRNYSRGMQTRLLLSLISSRPCELLILDEVFDGADRFFSEKTIPRMMKIIQDSGAVIFVSHSEEQIRKVCNRVLVLEKGKIIYDGGVEEGLEFYGKQS